MKQYYRVLHVYYLIDHVEVKDIGLFSTEEKAIQAIEQVKPFPGFSDHPDGFKIKKRMRRRRPKWVDQIYWGEGFDTYTYYESFAI